MNPAPLKNKPLKYKKLPTPSSSPSLFKLHTLSAFIGPRGSGKTNAVVLLARRYLDDGSINRIFIMSPTYDSNRIFELLDPEPEDVYKNIHTALQDLDKIQNEIKLSVEKYEDHKNYNAIYDKWKKFEAGRGPPLTLFEFNLMENNDFKPKERIPRPACLLIIDDMSHSQIYAPTQKNTFISLCLRHRHLFQVGLSIFMLVQNYKGGIPKCLRQNIQQYFIWPTHDLSQLLAMYEEFANLCPKEEFLEMYRRATSNKHDFMTIDINASEPLMRFRKCFDRILLPQNQISEEEINAIEKEVNQLKEKKKRKRC